MLKWSHPYWSYRQETATGTVSDLPPDFTPHNDKWNLWPLSIHYSYSKTASTLFLKFTSSNKQREEIKIKIIGQKKIKRNEHPVFLWNVKQGDEIKSRQCELSRQRTAVDKYGSIPITTVLFCHTLIYVKKQSAKFQ